MRPIATDQNPLRFPLNELLGAPANVRLLRVLADDVVGSIGVSEAAERTGLSPVGARRALAKLVKTGFVERIGSGHSQHYGLRVSDTLNDALRTLFACERDRYQALIEALKKALGELHEIQAAWVDGEATQAGMPLELAVLSDSRSLGHLGEQVRQRIIDIEQRFDVTIEVRTFSRADLGDVSLDEVELLTGYVEQASPSAGTTHAERDARAAVYSAAIAELLDSNPSLARRAERHLDYLLQDDQGSAAHDLQEWRNILAHYSQQRLRDFLVSDTPRAERLRQSSPFFAVRDADERQRVLAAAEHGE